MAASEKTDILSMNAAEMRTFVTEVLGEKPFRADQIYTWLHVHGVTDFAEMTNLSLNLRDRLQASCTIASVRIVKRLISGEDGTRKYLFRLSDGNVIESVMMPYHHGNAVCVSSQVGCRMGCAFCASTLNGLVRSLTAGEILSQVYAIGKDIGERISNVVVMGSGEPMDNYDAVVRFIRMLTDEKGLHISARNITVSTCGLVPGILKLSEENLPITLAISLHGVNDEEREKLMPVTRAYSIGEVLRACRTYTEKTGRRMTFEYSLIRGVNDSPAHAAALSGLLHDLHPHINLIPVNPIRERSFKDSERARVLEFKNILEKSGENVTIRREMGRDIQAACGQLRQNYLEKEEGGQGNR